ncbi:MAG: hypothetical protein M5U01_30010 [Ardenticatenaceae bacterium]|nr:hypothetical protein [Ardenticatenaceae bacterium]
MTLVITNTEAKGLMTVAAAHDVMKQVLIDMACGKAVNHPRYRMPTTSGFVQWGPARWDSMDAMGFKYWANAGSPLKGAWIYLYQMSTGELLAIIEAHHVSRCRTAAVSAVGAEALLGTERDKKLVLGIYGSGRQALGQVEALVGCLSISRVQCYSRDEAKRTAFAREITAHFKVDCVAVAHPSEAAAGAELIVTATSAHEPVLFGDWLDNVQVIVGMGANRTYERELDATVIRKMRTILVDDLEEAKQGCGDLLYSIEQGWLTWQSVSELPGVLAGHTNGGMERPALFESLGLSVTDVAIAWATYQAALEKGVGQKVTILG